MKGYGIVPTLDVEKYGFKGSVVAVWSALCWRGCWKWADGFPTTTEPGSLYPTVESIARAAGVSIRSANYALTCLERAGYLRREERTGEAGQRRSNGYILIAYPDEQESEDTVEPEHNRWAGW